MKIKILMDDRAKNENFFHEHGMSIWIETGDEQVCFDMGKTGCFLENAKKLDVDCSKANVAIISHGHIDHGGGLSDFLLINHTAPVFIQKKAFDSFCSERKDGVARIGLPAYLQTDSQIVLLENDYQINDHLYLFQKIEGKEYWPTMNNTLYHEVDDHLVLDGFEHEQYLIIREDEYTVLISGCSHRGIKNIMETAKKHIGKMPNVVIGGLHLSSSSLNEIESSQTIEEMAQYFMTTKTVIYTMHCTGIEPFQILHKKMGNQIKLVMSGDEIKLGESENENSNSNK